MSRIRGSLVVMQYLREDRLGVFYRDVGVKVSDV